MSHTIQPKEEYSGSLYRFVHFEGLGGLVEIVQNQALVLVHHTKWEDPYEGYIYQAIMRPEKREEILGLIEEIAPHNPSFTFSILHDFSTTLFGQSWTLEKEKLWDLYPPNNQGRCVRVQINTESLKKIPAEKPWERITPFEIDYVEEPNLKEDLAKSVVGNQISFGHTLLRKRKTKFEHEREVRLTIMDQDYSLFHRRNIPEMIDKIGRIRAMINSGILPVEAYEANVKDDVRILNKLRTPDIRKVSFAGVEHFIESVMVHPRADDHYSMSVKEFCDNHAINFLGKAVAT